MLPPALELERVRKVFSRKERSLVRRVSHPNGKKDVVALESLDLSVARREIFGVLGPNSSVLLGSDLAS
jgi:ABC-type multidrug transport system ATPase subunit